MAGIIMAGQTSNYNFDYPTSTDYVKDGATAIQELADDVDATLFTALGGDYPGLRLIKKQIIGSAVASVTVTGAFSSTYENYKVIVSGGTSSTNGNALLTLGSTNTGYYSAGMYTAYNSTTVVGLASSNSSSWANAVSMQTTTVIGDFTLYSPNLAKATTFDAQHAEPNTGGVALIRKGFLNDTTQYTAFTLTPSSGTLTGGTIYVYGYGAS
jgi:hypothetical protein